MWAHRSPWRGGCVCKRARFCAIRRWRKPTAKRCVMKRRNSSQQHNVDAHKKVWGSLVVAFDSTGRTSLRMRYAANGQESINWMHIQCHIERE